MCGIGLHAVTSHCTDNCTFCNTDGTHSSLIRTCIAHAIEPRGPDIPNSHLHHPPSADFAWDVFLCASLLHMRGPVPTPQPYCLTQADHHYAFLWNGECYSITQPSQDLSNASYDTAFVKNCNLSHDSDTQVVLHTLLHSAFTHQDTSDAAFDTLSKVAQTMSSIQGEYAFILWVHPNSETSEQSVHHTHIRQDHGSIYFARDPLGRRSLLMHTCPASTISSSSSSSSSAHEDSTETMISSLILSSVALTDFFIHGQDAVSIQGDSAKTIVHPIHEVVPGRVYHLDLFTGRLSFATIPTIIPPTLSSISLLDLGLPLSHLTLDNFMPTSSGESSCISPSTLQAAEQLFRLLHRAVRRRVVDLSSYPDALPTRSSKVAVLFSGGLDSVVLAALSHFHIPMDQSIDLINVSFASSHSETSISHSSTSGSDHLKSTLTINQSLVHGHSESSSQDDLEQRDQTIRNKNDPFESPDRIAAIQSFHELCRLWPQRPWKLILVNVIYSEVLNHQTRIRTLIHPLSSTMDFNIATAMWFASRGIGFEYTNTSYNSPSPHEACQITSDSRIVLVGIGADEQMAGYGRHRSVYHRGGYDALRNELKMEKSRLWTRNLGRDDRIISDHGKEARFPYLDEDVVSFLNTLDATEVCDMTKPPGVGDKLILRLIAQKMGLSQCSGLVKRAIQFGSRIAKVSDVQRFGSSQKAQGWKTFQ